MSNSDKCQVIFITRWDPFYYVIKSSAGRCVRIDSPISDLGGFSEKIKRDFFLIVDFIRGHDNSHIFQEITLSYEIMHKLLELSTWKIKSTTDDLSPRTWIHK